jgi:hypothetical protein
LTLKLHRRAESEIREAAEWYGSREVGLDRRFIEAVRAAFEVLERSPEQLPNLKQLLVKSRYADSSCKIFPMSLSMNRSMTRCLYTPWHLPAGGRTTGGGANATHDASSGAF